MKDLCRACLGVVADPSNSLFSEDESRETSAYRLWKCTGVRPVQGDLLPESLCEKCSTFLSFSNHFRLLVEKSNNLLLQCAHVKVVLEPKLEIKPEMEANVEDKESKFCIDPYIENIKHEPDDNVSDIDITEVKIEVDETYSNDFSQSEPANCINNQNEDLIERDLDTTDFIRDPSDSEAETEKITEFYENVDHKVLGQDFRRFKCPKCPYSASKKSRMADHYRVHTGEKPHKCSKCRKRFTAKGTLNEHYRIEHSDTAYYVCDKCGKNFKTRKTYTYHMKYRHVGENPHSCPYCVKTFKYKSRLDNHMLVHTHMRHVQSDFSHQVGVDVSKKEV